jgi:D-aminoacyl-tRNA deacylase
VGSIGRGVAVLVGITDGDTHADQDYLIRKILNLKLWETPADDEQKQDQQRKPWSRSVVDQELEVLVVSQFTLYAMTSKGNRPDFHLAMKPTDARPFYDTFLQRLRDAYKPELVQCGEFGSMMRVHLENDGPVTIMIDSKQK